MNKKKIWTPLKKKKDLPFQKERMLIYSISDSNVLVNLAKHHTCPECEKNAT
jgi:hypothetical protein